MSANVEKGLSSTENLKRFIDIIIPLLLDCWVEASPTQPKAPIFGNLLEPGSQQLMEQVLSIIHLLWKLAKQHENAHEMVRTLTYLEQLSFLYIEYYKEKKANIVLFFSYEKLKNLN